LKVKVLQHPNMTQEGSLQCKVAKILGMKHRIFVWQTVRREFS